MKPEIDQILRFSAAQLLTQIAPSLPVSYSQGTASLIGFMLMMSAAEFERAADIRVAENADLRALFLTLAPCVGDPALRAELMEASQTRDGALTISALNEGNYALRRLLITLQSHVEEKGDRQSSAQIWTVLKAMAARRFVSPPGA